MTWLGMIADFQDPNDPQGRSYRKVNAERKHIIAVGALVELVHTERSMRDGVRLHVVRHDRDCDMTPLYALELVNDDSNPREFMVLLSGYPEDALRVIKP
jgi:hypothetical protein